MSITNAVNENRAGTFTIERDIIRTMPEIAFTALCQVLIVRADMDYMTDGVRYQGYCEFFDPLERGYMLPEYTPYFENSDDIIIVTWKKQP